MIRDDGEIPVFEVVPAEGLDDVQLVEQVLEQTGILSLRDRTLDHLSGG